MSGSAGGPTAPRGNRLLTTCEMPMCVVCCVLIAIQWYGNALPDATLLQATRHNDCAADRALHVRNTVGCPLVKLAWPAAARARSENQSRLAGGSWGSFYSYLRMGRRLQRQAERARGEREKKREKEREKERKREREKE